MSAGYWPKNSAGRNRKMGKFAERAVANHKKKYNCAQAVACAFCEELGRDEKEVFEMMEAFGFGMGTM